MFIPNILLLSTCICFLKIDLSVTLCTILKKKLFFIFIKMYLFLAKTLTSLSPSQVNSNQNPHLKNWFLVNSLLITCYAFIGHKIKDGQNLELLHFNISKCIQQQKLCIMLKNFMRVSKFFFWKELFCQISHGSFLWNCSILSSKY